MSVVLECRYEGYLHCTAIHGPSGDRLVTDAPVDNQGRGEHFSPTDLVATSIGVCALTIMGIAARARGIDLEGATASVTKKMGATPRRHIAKLTHEQQGRVAVFANGDSGHALDGRPPAPAGA